MPTLKANAGGGMPTFSKKLQHKKMYAKMHSDCKENVYFW